MSPFLVCSPALIISGLAPMESGLDILRGSGEGGRGTTTFHQAGKLKKHLGYQALADALHPVCAQFSFFPPFHLCFFSSSAFLVVDWR